MSNSARSNKSKDNKIYRTPPSPNPDVLRFKEKSFILDCRAVSNISRDYARANPKHGSVIPPYNGQRDKSAKKYFQIKGVEDVLKRNRQSPPGSSIEGPILERFFISGKGAHYLTSRNNHGCGLSPEEFEGHSYYMSDIKDYNIGFNGKFGYRRNTPFLRKHPSSFGVLTKSSLYK